jgi:hypothetical protein
MDDRRGVDFASDDSTLTVKMMRMMTMNTKDDVDNLNMMI